MRWIHDISKYEDLAEVDDLSISFMNAVKVGDCPLARDYWQKIKALNLEEYNEI